jgi:Lrp/AsnC ligand binding domain
MLSAYVLIQTEVGKAGQVAQAIGGIDGVQRAEDVAGPYDVIARVQAPAMDELGRLVVARIQAVDGVTRTLTCTMIRANPGRRHGPAPELPAQGWPSGPGRGSCRRWMQGDDQRDRGSLAPSAGYRLVGPAPIAKGFREPETTCAEPMPSDRRRFDGRPDQVLLARQFVASALVEDSPIREVARLLVSE